MQRWLLRILLVLGGLIVTAVVAVQVILATDLPRMWTLSAIERKLQLRVSAAKFSTTWMGQATLREVSLALPLSKESFIVAPTVRLRHTPLVGLAVGRGFEIDTIEIERPNLMIRQRSDGQWNVQEVSELIRRSGGGKQPETNTPPRSGALPRLPNVNVTDGIIRIVDAGGRQATLQPVQIQGRRESDLVWSCRARIDDRIQITGRVAPGRAWPHRLDISLRGLGAMARAFVPPRAVSLLDSLQFKGTWDGQFDSKFAGRLEVERLAIGGCNVSGPIQVAIENGRSLLTPAGLVVEAPSSVAPPVRANGGTIALAQQSITTKDLALAFGGGEVRLEGGYNWGDRSAELKASWNRLVYPAGTAHSGDVTFRLSEPWPDQPVVFLALNTVGKTGGADWRGGLELRGRGDSWKNIQWQLTAPQLHWVHKGQTWDLSSLAAEVRTQADRAVLNSLTIPPGKLYGNLTRGDLDARGQYEFASGNWTLFLTGARWPLVEHNPAPASFVFNASGSPRSVWLEQFSFQVGQVRIWAGGGLDLSRRGVPVELDVFGWYPTGDVAAGEARDDQAAKLPLQGRLRTALRLTQNAWPMDLKIAGRLVARDVVLGKHAVGDVEMRLAGMADRERVHLETHRLQLLSGSWELAADLLYKPRHASIRVGLKDLSLAQLDNLLAPPPNLRGYVSGDWRVQIPHLDPRAMTAQGEWTVDRLALWSPPPPPTTAEPLVRGPEGAVQASYIGRSTPEVITRPQSRQATASTQPSGSASTRWAAGKLYPLADRIEGQISIVDRQVRLSPINLRLGDGRGAASIAIPLDRPEQLRVDSTIAAWPLELPAFLSNARLLVWASSRVDLDLGKATARGPVQLWANLWVGDQLVARAQTKAELQQRRIELGTLAGDILGGTLEGEGVVDLEHPLLSAGAIQWKNMDAARITQVYPIVTGLTGRSDGHVRFAPAHGHRDIPDGSLVLGGAATVVSGRYKTIDLGPLEFRGHVGDRRAVLEHLQWHVAGGTWNGWGRSTWYEGSTPQLHLTSNFVNLNLQQIVHAFQPGTQQRKALPGKLNGRLMIAGNPATSQGRRQASGEGFIRLVESDLANSTIVNALYSVMSVRIGRPEPTGRGFARFRLEGPRMEIPTVRYFNRGVDLWASGTVRDVFAGRDAVLAGSAAGSARPLRDLKIPFAADADRILQALQGGLATVRIAGTVAQPHVQVIPFSEAGEAFHRLLIGEVRSGADAIPGR